MVAIQKQNNNFIFEVKGLHKLWSFKSSLTIPAEHIINVTHDLQSINGWHGWRLPGTEVPFVLTAGTFYKDGKRVFWDATHKDKCIIITLKDEDYQQLVIEVEDPQTAMALLMNK